MKLPLHHFRCRAGLVLGLMMSHISGTGADADASTLTTWTDANLIAWWKTRPDPESWKAGGAALLEALRAAQVKNGAARALENRHFLGWVVHQRWIDLFPADYQDHAFFSKEEARHAFRSLSVKKTLPQLLVSSLAPEDDAAKALENLCRIALAHPEAVYKYPALAVAIAVVFDRPFPESWPHPFTKQELLYKGDLEPEKRFAFHVRCEEAGGHLLRVEDLSVKELTFMVDSILRLEEMGWAQQIKLKNPDHLAGLYSVIHYDRARSSSADFMWPHANYTMPEIRDRGGICMDQAYFVAQAGKANGVPTILFQGQGRSGGHAWVGYLKERGKWELSMARIRSEKYPVGTMFDPQTWRRLTDAQFRFVMADLTKTSSYNLVEPYVERCMEGGKKALAMEAMRSLETVVRPQPNSLLAADVQKLRNVVEGVGGE